MATVRLNVSSGPYGTLIALEKQVSYWTWPADWALLFPQLAGLLSGQSFLEENGLSGPLSTLLTWEISDVLQMN